MKFKEKNKMQNVGQKPSTSRTQSNNNSSWEMSAQDALRVDYVTRKRPFPISQH